MNSSQEKYIQAILASKEFAHSESSKRLLEYIIEQSLQHKIPKEIDIAMTIFGRDSSYDPSVDSLVRSHMYTLRNKLEKYYLTEGKDDKIRLTIPKGRYEIVFAEAPEPPGQARRSARHYVLLVALLIFLPILTLFIEHRFDFISDNRYRDLNTFPWHHFYQSDKPTLVVLGDYFAYVLRVPGDDRVRHVRNGDINSMADLSAYLEHHPEIAARFNGATHTYSPIHVVPAAMQLLPSFIEGDIDINVTYSSQLTPEQIQENNIIFLGSGKTYRLLQPYFEQSNYTLHYYPHYTQVRSRQDSSQFETFRVQIQEGFSYRKDYGVIVKMAGPADTIIMFVSTFSGRGLGIVMEYIISGQLAKAIDAKTETRPTFFEALVKIDMVSDSQATTLEQIRALD